MLQAIPAATLPHEWETIGPALAQAVTTDMRTLAQVRDALASGDMQAWRTSAGVVVTATGTVIGTSVRALWVMFAAGRTSGRTEYHEIMRQLAHVARAERCEEIRVEGCRAAKWARVVGFDHLSDDVYRKAI